MPYNYGLCQCVSTAPRGKHLISRLMDECIEFAMSPSVDELGDISCIASQIVYLVTGVPVILPFADKALSKGRRRYEEHGCVRSKRNKCS